MIKVFTNASDKLLQNQNEFGVYSSPKILMLIIATLSLALYWCILKPEPLSFPQLFCLYYRFIKSLPVIFYFMCLFIKLHQYFFVFLTVQIILPDTFYEYGFLNTRSLPTKKLSLSTFDRKNIFWEKNLDSNILKRLCQQFRHFKYYQKLSANLVCPKSLFGAMAVVFL